MMTGDGEIRPPGALSEDQFEREQRRAALELERRLGLGEERPRAGGAAVARRLTWVAGVVLLLAALAGGLVAALRTIPDLRHTRIGATRTPVPGSRDAELGAGKYVVYYAAGTTGGAGLARPRGVQVRIAAPGQPPLPLRPYSGNFHIGSSHVDARAFLTVRVPRAGRYRIVTSGHSDQPINASAPRIVLGVPTGGRILRLVGGGVLALLAFIGLCFAVPAAVGRRPPRHLRPGPS